MLHAYILQMSKSLYHNGTTGFGSMEPHYLMYVKWTAIDVMCVEAIYSVSAFMAAEGSS